ncbi:hypothetical protein K438DRAFT_1996033 [Mycena galopus ATCC 62051]|nr:hypothetical protein K438DRAFT_2003971 [Mycena galopus ATCC 62051]KAF8139427.1 hypothetical protein K438DRAFT_1996033 [Mycena galopus ATCC 62051]
MTQNSKKIVESDPASYQRYKKWVASRAYNDRNRDARNAKKRERMAALRAKQQLDSPIVKAGRLAAKEESARKYREKNRSILAIKSFAARAVAREKNLCDRHHLDQEAFRLTLQQRRDLDLALEALEPESEQE